MERNKVIGRNVKFLREEKGLKTENLARLSFMSTTTLNSIEHGDRKKPINKEHLEHIAKALKVSVDALTGENPEIIARLESLELIVKKGKFTEENINASDKLVIDTKLFGPEERAKSIYLRGRIAFELDFFADAYNWYSESVKIAEAAHLDDLNLYLYSQAACSLRQGYYDKVLCLEERVTDIEDLALQSKFLYLFAVSYKRKGDYQKAIEFLESGIDKMPDDVYEYLAYSARCYQVLGDIYRELSDYEEAIYYSKISKKLAAQALDVVAEIYALRTMALTFIDQDDLDSARSYIEQIRQHEKMSLKISKLEKLINDFYYAYCNGQYEAMIAVVNDISNYEIAPSDLTKMYEHLGDIAINSELYIEAKLFYKKALALMRRQK